MLLISKTTKTKNNKTNQTGSREPDLRSRVREQEARSSWALANWLLRGARAAMEGVREQARIEGGQHQELLAPGPFKDQGAREPVTREILIPWSVTLDLRSGSLDPVWFVFLLI